MNSVCMKCKEWMNPVEDIFATTCGHLFHKICLKQWVERGSQTCPCCPNVLSLKSVFLLHPPAPNAADGEKQSSLLHSSLDAAQALISYQKDLFKQRDEKFKELHNEIRKQKEVINVSKKKNEEFQQNIEELNNKMVEDEASYKKQILDLEGKRNQLIADEEQRKVIVNALIENQKIHFEQIAKLTTENNLLNINVESLTAQVNKKTMELQTREAKIDKVFDKIDIFRAENQMLENVNETLKESVKNLKEELSTANKKLERRDKSLAARKVVHLDQVDIIGADDSKMNEIKNDVKKLRNELASLYRRKTKKKYSRKTVATKIYNSGKYSGAKFHDGGEYSGAKKKPLPTHDVTNVDSDRSWFSASDDSDCEDN